MEIFFALGNITGGRINFLALGNAHGMGGRYAVGARRNRAFAKAGKQKIW